MREIKFEKMTSVPLIEMDFDPKSRPKKFTKKELGKLVLKKKKNATSMYIYFMLQFFSRYFV